MPASYAQAAAHNALLRAALRCIAADYFADDANPHAEAESEHASERLALAARELVAAVDALPEGDQPIGWHREPQSAEPAPAEDQAVADAALAPHRVRIYRRKPAHAPEFWANHPTDCNTIPYGEKCWFDALVEVERDNLVPWKGWPDAGFYVATAPAEGATSIQFESVDREES